jgi:SAM-dependent methyltransferase
MYHPLMEVSSQKLASREILTRGVWYHTFDFQEVVTPGTYDYRKIIERIPWPDMKGKSVLDVGCSDGFFSLYFAQTLSAQRVIGVDANSYDGKVPLAVTANKMPDFEEKYALNDDYSLLESCYRSLELENSNKFIFMKKLLDLKNVEFKEGSVYHLENFQKADIVFCGSLLEHLRDPLTALEQLKRATKSICIIDLSGPLRLPWPANTLPLLKYNSGGGSFYNISEVALMNMMKSVGFSDVERIMSYKIYNEKKSTWNFNSIVVGSV